MKIIISPAKKMNVDTDSLDWQALPEFLDRTGQLLEKLRGMSYDELKKLWKCSDQIAEQNLQRLQKWTCTAPDPGHPQLRRNSVSVYGAGGVHDLGI